MYVVATAGHVDHGKSTLLRALTAMEPDRWEEERQRGMTIDLGYVWTRLPAGEQIAFVDVPGHERFVGNMLAGVGPVPAVLFVVAADEGWMPQSAEHLAALDALGVQHGLLVITRCDRAEPSLAIEEARDYLRGTTLADIPAVPVCAPTGAGIPELLSALQRMVSELPRPDPHAPVRFWVDRSFGVRGSGTVVTGTLGAGTIRSGDVLRYGATGQARVRALQSLREERTEVGPVSRVALNLKVTGREQIRRGTALVTADRWESTWTLDGWLDLRRSGEGEPVCPSIASFHIGSARVATRVRRLGATDGVRLAVRLSLASPLPLHVGDQALLRDGNQARGSRVIGRVTVLDVPAPVLRRRGGAAVRGAYLRSLNSVPDGLELLAQRGVVRRPAFISIGCEPPGQALVGDWYVSPDHAAQLRQRLGDATAEYLTTHPLEQGLTVESARHLLDVPDRRIVEALVQAPLELHDGRITDTRLDRNLPRDIAEAVDLVRKELTENPFRAPDVDRLAALGLDRRALAAAERDGRLLRIAEDLVLLPDADLTALKVLSGLPQPFTVSAAREALDSTRRVVVPLLEYLDRKGLTERLDDTRRQCSADR